MSSVNPFDLLGDDDNDDPSQLIAAQEQKIAAKKPVPAAAALAPAKLPTKPLPPAQAVKEARNNGVQTRGGANGARGGGGRGRGGRGGAPGPNRDFGKENVNGFSSGYGYGGAAEDGDTGKPTERERGSYGGPRQPYHGGGRRGGYVNGEAGGDSEPPPRRVFERRSGTGRGNEIKREGSGRGNWGNQNDDVLAQLTDEVVNTEDNTVGTEQPEQDAPASEAIKDGNDGAAVDNAEKEEEDKEMTLEEYEKIREEKRKALLALKTQERKVDLDEELESMQQLSIKKGNDEIFIKLGSDKDSRKLKENADREERARKSLSINEFLKPAEGERYYSPGGRGRGRGDRGPYRGGARGHYSAAAEVNIKIEDPGQFPTLGGK